MLCVSALGMGLCVSFIALVRLPSLKVSTLLLVGLLVYDVFWVSYTSTLYHFILYVTLYIIGHYTTLYIIGLYTLLYCMTLHRDFTS